MESVVHYARVANRATRMACVPLKPWRHRDTAAARISPQAGDADGQHPQTRLDRYGPHGLPHGRAAAQGRLRRLDLEPHARQGRAAAPRAAKSSTSCPTSRRRVLFSIVSTGKDLEEVYFGKNGVIASGGKMPKIVVDCSTIAVEESADDPRAAQAARRRFRRRAGVAATPR